MSRRKTAACKFIEAKTMVIPKPGKFPDVENKPVKSNTAGTDNIEDQKYHDKDAAAITTLGNSSAAQGIRSALGIGKEKPPGPLNPPAATGPKRWGNADWERKQFPDNVDPSTGRAPYTGAAGKLDEFRPKSWGAEQGRVRPEDKGLNREQILTKQNSANNLMQQAIKQAHGDGSFGGSGSKPPGGAQPPWGGGGGSPRDPGKGPDPGKLPPGFNPRQPWGKTPPWDRDPGFTPPKGPEQPWDMDPGFTLPRGPEQPWDMDPGFTLPRGPEQPWDMDPGIKKPGTPPGKPGTLPGKPGWKDWMRKQWQPPKEKFKSPNIMEASNKMVEASARNPLDVVKQATLNKNAIEDYGSDKSLVLAQQPYLHPGVSRRDVSPDEEETIAKKKEQWFPRIFESKGMPLTDRLSSPGKGALMAGLGGGAVGALGGALVGGSLASRRMNGPGAMLGAGIGGLGLGGLSALMSYYGRDARNEGILEDVRRFPEGSTLRDLQSDPVYQGQMQREADARISRRHTGGNAGLLAAVLASR